MLYRTPATQYPIRLPWARPPQTPVRFQTTPSDVLVQCPKCKTVETLQFVGSVLTPCRKFRQQDGLVYHDCGSERPCRLHRQSASYRPTPREPRW